VTARDERAFGRMLRFIGRRRRHLPTVIRMFPFNFFLADVRRRTRKGIRSV